MPSCPSPGVPSVAITYCYLLIAQPAAKSAIDVAATTTPLPYTGKDHRDHPEITEPSPKEIQAHHPNKDATTQAAGAGLVAPLDAPADDPAEPLPAVLCKVVPKALAIPTD